MRPYTVYTVLKVGGLQVHLRLPNSASQAADMDFTGGFEASKDGLDCVAAFDGTSWHLELVSAVGRNLRYTLCSHKAYLDSCF